MWNGVFIWNFYWAACGAQFWNGLSLFKNDKMADGSPWRRCVSHSHFNGPISAGRGRVISGRLANKFGSRFGTNTKLLPGVIGPISAPSDYLSTVFDDVILACAGAAETMPPPPLTVPMGKPSTCTGCCDSLPACVKSFPNMLFVRQIETYSLAMDS